MPTHKILCDLDVRGEVQGTSLDINGIANITSAAGTAHLLTLHNTTNAEGCSINFSDVTAGNQTGTIDFFHADSMSQGGGASFVISSSEADMVLNVGGRIVVAPHGSNAEVDYGFVDDIDTGMMRSSNHAIRFVTGGTAALDINASQNATFAGDVTVGDDIFIADGGIINLGSGNDLTLFHDGSDAVIRNNTGHIYFDNLASDKDIYFRGSDGGSTITALSLDMSHGGNATFNASVTTGGTVNVNNAGSDKKISFDRTGGKGISIEHDASSIYFYNETDAAPMFKMLNGGDVRAYGEVEATSLDINGSADISGSLLISTDLTVNGKITQAGVVDYERYGRTYTVNVNAPLPLLTSDGSALPTGGGYRVTGHISGTGTEQVAMAVFWNENGTWNINKTFEGGTSSNHVEFKLLDHGSGSVPTVTLETHTSNYNVHVYHERLALEEGTGNDNLRGYFGADSYLSFLESTNTLTLAGNLIIADSHTIGDDADDNLEIKSSSGENVIIDGASSVLLRDGGSTKLQTSSSGVTVTGTATATTFSGDLNGTVNTSTTATTQSAGNNSTKVATTAYVDTAVSNLVDSAPGTLNTLNELADALGDDADFSTTVTNSIAAKLPLSGGTMTGAITIPEYINHTGDGNTVFGFASDDVFRVITGGTTRLDIGSGIEMTGNTAVTGNITTTGGDSVAPQINILHDGTNPGTNEELGVIQFQVDYDNSHQDWGKIRLDTNANAVRTNMEFYVKSASGAEQVALTLEGQSSAVPNTTVAGTLTVEGADAITIPDYILHAGDDSKFGFPSNDNFKIRLAGSDKFTMSATTATFNNNVEVADLDISGTATGDGSGLTDLNGSEITTGTIAAARVATLNQNTTGSSGSCTGNAATATTATTATNANNVKTTSVSNSTDYFGVFVDANGTAYQDLHVGSGLKYNPSSDILTAGKLTSDTVRIVENAKSTGIDGTAGAGQACMTITGAGAGNESNITLKIVGTDHGSPVKIKMTAENTDGTGVGNGIISYHPDTDTLGIGQTTTHNSMAILIDNNDVVSMKNETTFTNGIDVTSAVNSTSKTTGTVKIAGGVGIVKALNVGQDVVAFASSDKRYKDNLQAITNPIDKVKSLTGYTFTWNDKHEQFNGNDDIGVVAQEVEKVFPEIVDTRDDGYKAVKYEKMVALLIEAVKDQQKQIDELKEKCNGCSC